MSSPRPRLTRGESLHQQIARNIRNDIAAGILHDGDVLPASRELADRWGVSVFTISEAMKVLAGEGLIENKSRSKRVVRAPDRSRRNEIRLRRPHVLLIGGYAGSGKTELGRILTRETGWPMLDKDTLTRPVVEIALEVVGQSPDDRDSDTYLSLIRPREYEALISTTKENVECGNSAIVTAPFVQEFGDHAWIGRTQAVLSSMEATTTLVWVHCDADTMHAYIRHRGAARDAAKLADWPGWLARINVDFRPVASHIVIDNSASSAPLQNQAQELLKSVLGGDIS